MNWPEIRKKYPKPWNLLLLFNLKPEVEGFLLSAHLFGAYELPHTEEETDAHNRDLFDFFDYNDVWIEIEIEKVGRWNYYIYGCHGDDSVDIIKSNNDRYYPTRKEAEEEVFIQSFVILEKKLKLKKL